MGGKVRGRSGGLGVWVMLNDTVSCSIPASMSKPNKISFPPSAGSFKPVSTSAKINTSYLSVSQVNILSYIFNMHISQILEWALTRASLPLGGETDFFSPFGLALLSTEYCVALAIILSALLCTPVTNPFSSIMLRPCNGIWNSHGLSLCPCMWDSNT